MRYEKVDEKLSRVSTAMEAKMLKAGIQELELHAFSPREQEIALLAAATVLFRLIGQACGVTVDDLKGALDVPGSDRGAYS